MSQERKLRHKVKDILTNGWSGWIRIGILLFAFGAAYAQLKEDISHLADLFERHECAAKEVVKDLKKDIAAVRDSLYRHVLKDKG